MERRKLHYKVFIAVSLDGFIARENGDIDWLEKIGVDEKEDYGYKDFMHSIDALLMGRRTYEKVLTFAFWPYQCPVVVTSSSLSSKDIPHELAGKVEIISGEVAQLNDTLVARGFSNVYIDGGRLIRSFLVEKLISDIIITRVPVLLGRGRRLFGEIKEDMVFEHQSSRSYASGFVQSHYQYH